MTAVRVAIAGGSGRMGRTLCDLVLASEHMELTAVSARSESGRSPAVDASLFTSDLSAVLPAAQVFVDFTLPDAVSSHAALCRDTRTAWVLGTTGLSAEQQETVVEAARSVAVCQAANFSTGVNLMLRLAELAASAAGDDTDLEVVEAHHRYKVDAPSGTALAIGRALATGRARATGRKVDLDTQAVFHREGHTGSRPRDAIGFATVRGGDIVGEHTALFAADGERLEITHRASTRDAFARGALRAALWLAQQPPGLYDMQDVLKLRT